MFEKHALLFFSFVLAVSFHVNAQEQEGTEHALTQKETTSTKISENVATPSTQTCLPFTGSIIGSKVRMRVSPTLEGHVVRETSAGELFVIVGETNDYYAVIPPKEAKGYVFRTFILDGVVEGDRVNIRLYPDTDAPVIGQLNTGDRVDSVISELNNKWLEISLPSPSRFYIAKEYIENKGPVELFAIIEKKQAEGAHRLSAATLFAQAEIQKPFEQIDLDRVNDKFNQIAKEYQELPTLVAQVRDAANAIQDIYVHKKVAFLEGKTTSRTYDIDSDQLEKLVKASPEKHAEKNMEEIATAGSKTIGLSSLLSEREITDKMLLWQPLEESLYHLWVAVNGEKNMDEFYAAEEQAALCLTGIVEPYTRPVKNKPGDFLLRDGTLPIAFLYSTRVNLEKLVGQKITMIASPRPNHNFAFPAYFVISVE